MFFHPFIQRLLTTMPKGRVSKIVSERDAFCQILVELKSTRNVSADLRYFHGMREPGPHMIILFSCDKHLCLPLQSPERKRVNNAVAVALEGEAGFVGGFGDFAAERSEDGD